MTQKEKAITARKRGCSYNEISKDLGIAKSTLSSWFRVLPELANVRISNDLVARQKAAKSITAYNKKRSIAVRARWLIEQDKTRKEIGVLSKRELLLVGTALYWGEGYKKTNWNLVFCNSDYLMVALMMRFFKEVCEVPIEKMRAQIQIYPGMDVNEIIDFWVGITGIGRQHFYKPICVISSASKLKKGNTLPLGTIRIRINDVNLVNQIKGWILGLANA